MKYNTLGPKRLTSKNGVIEALRLFFAITIVLAHSNGLIGYADHPIMGGGGYAVEFFFILSGFLMAQSAERTQISGIASSTMCFMKRKIFSILPYYLVSFAAAALTYLIANGTGKANSLDNNLAPAFFELTFLRITGLGGTGPWLNGVTWYLSALFAAMLVLYPLHLKTGKTFTTVIAPVVACFSLGFIYLSGNSLGVGPIWNGNLISLGLLRAAGEISLGCISFAIFKKLRRSSLTRLSFFLLLLLEVICYVGTFWGICNGFLPFVGYIVPFVLSLGIILTFSLHSDSRVFSKPAFRYLGIFSLVLYLNHRYWCVFLNKIAPFSTMDYALRFVTYLILSIASALMCWVIVFCFRKIKQCVGPKIKTWLISS